jgi:succinate dehydrogenase/fumarate reductase flavoprotein subunit
MSKRVLAVAEFRETDVLVIGSGGAGLMAAIQADKNKAKVMIVTKGKITSGCAAISMGGAQAAYDQKESILHIWR